jgi:hypothetical protein
MVFLVERWRSIDVAFRRQTPLLVERWPGDFGEDRQVVTNLPRDVLKSPEEIRDHDYWRKQSQGH